MNRRYYVEVPFDVYSTESNSLWKFGRGIGKLLIKYKL